MTSDGPMPNKTCTTKTRIAIATAVFAVAFTTLTSQAKTRYETMQAAIRRMISMSNSAQHSQDSTMTLRKWV